MNVTKAFFALLLVVAPAGAEQPLELNETAESVVTEQLAGGFEDLGIDQDELAAYCMGRIIFANPEDCQWTYLADYGRKRFTQSLGDDEICLLWDYNYNQLVRLVCADLQPPREE